MCSSTWIYSLRTVCPHFQWSSLIVRLNFTSGLSNQILLLSSAKCSYSFQKSCHHCWDILNRSTRRQYLRMNKALPVMKEMLYLFSKVAASMLPSYSYICNALCIFTKKHASEYNCLSFVSPTGEQRTLCSTFLPMMCWCRNSLFPSSIQLRFGYRFWHINRRNAESKMFAELSVLYSDVQLNRNTFTC